MGEKGRIHTYIYIYRDIYIVIWMWMNARGSVKEERVREKA